MIFIAINKDSKSFVDIYFNKNYDELVEFVECIIKKDERNKQFFYNNWQVVYWGNSMVEFIVETRGVGSSTSYKGFYYSPDDKPLGFQGNNVEFVEDGIGWKWKENDGDNWEYTERIVTQWYWFEIHF